MNTYLCILDYVNSYSCNNSIVSNEGHRNPQS